MHEAGCPRIPVTASRDVELQIAAEMRDTGITDATVVINNQPCTGPTSCDGLLEVVLPAGSTRPVRGARGCGGTIERWGIETRSSQVASPYRRLTCDDAAAAPPEPGPCRDR
ncbi:hypothetical protein ILP97_01595 [Amycolatopsis sp. H6(2020)]|nr:hypothetical protein [Amycolatopsis sp. H6(2020)]